MLKINNDILSVQIHDGQAVLLYNNQVVKNVSDEFYISFIKRFGKVYTLYNWNYKSFPIEHGLYYVAVTGDIDNLLNKKLTTFAMVSSFDGEWWMMSKGCKVYAWTNIPDNCYNDNGFVDDDIFISRPVEMLWR